MSAATREKKKRADLLKRMGGRPDLFWVGGEALRCQSVPALTDGVLALCGWNGWGRQTGRGSGRELVAVHKKVRSNNNTRAMDTKCTPYSVLVQHAGSSVPGRAPPGGGAADVAVPKSGDGRSESGCWGAWGGDEEMRHAQEG